MSSAIRDLPLEVFAKLSPHRTHESNWFKSLQVGLASLVSIELGARHPGE